MEDPEIARIITPAEATGRHFCVDIEFSPNLPEEAYIETTQEIKQAIRVLLWNRRLYPTSKIDWVYSHDSVLRLTKA